MKKYVIEPSELKRETVELCEEFVTFWREFADEINSVPSENIDEIVSKWSKYFSNHNKTILRLIKVKMAMEQFEGDEPDEELAASVIKSCEGD